MCDSVSANAILQNESLKMYIANKQARKQVQKSGN